MKLMKSQIGKSISCTQERLHFNMQVLLSLCKCRFHLFIYIYLAALKNMGDDYNFTIGAWSTSCCSGFSGFRAIHISGYCCHKLKVISNSLTGNICTSMIFWPLFLKRRKWTIWQVTENSYCYGHIPKTER